MRVSLRRCGGDHREHDHQRDGAQQADEQDGFAAQRLRAVPRLVERVTLPLAGRDVPAVALRDG
jgi:hypothetical protein